MKKYLRLVLFIIIPLAVGAVSGAITAESIPTWYVTLNKPFFNPPNYLFGPVWTLLYLLMGISFFMVYEMSKGSERRKVVLVFVTQLVLNFFWSIVFFGLKSPSIAFFEIIAMWTSILFMIFTFFKIDRLAAFIQIPYILWVSFATLLNGAIWYLN